MSKKKGDRRERQARTILQEDGYNTESPNSTPYQQQVVDFFEVFDIMAVKPGEPVFFVQVKSNTARGIRTFHKECIEQQIPFDHVRVEFWVCHDGEGWRIFEITENGHEKVYDERDTNKNVLHTRAENRDDFNLQYKQS